MKCPNCGEEIGEEKKCNKCGTVLNSSKTEEKSAFEPIQEETKQKKTNKALFVILAIIVIMIALAVYYALTMNTPRYIFDKKISEMVNSGEENTNYQTLKANADLEISINTDESEVKEIANLLNDTKFSFITELDQSTQEELVRIQMSKNNEMLLDANMKLEAESQNLYVNLGEFFDKTILTDISQISDETFEIADASVTTFGQKISSKKAKTILQKEIKNELKDEYFSTEKAVIDNENVTKNILRLSTEEFITVIQNVCKNLADNEEFIDCFEEGDALREDLTELVDSLDDLDVEEDVFIEIDVYTVGFMKTIKRIDISADDEDNKVIMQLTKASDDEYNYELLEDDEKILEGKINYKEENNHFTFEMTANVDSTKLIIKLSGNTIYDEELSDFDTSNVVNYEELTTEDIYTILGNFMNSKLYKVVEEFSNTNTSSLLMENSADKDTDDVETNNTNNKTSSTTEKNILKTYNNKQIKFNIPEGFEAYSSDSEYYKLFEKEVNDDEIQVDVSVSYDTLEEYIEEIKDKAKYYEEQEYYENIKVSDVEELEVNGNKFSKIVITYDYGFYEDNKTPRNEMYIACEIDEENVYTVEIDGADLMTNNEIEEFLTIKK